MKKYAIILLALFLIGVGLSVRLFTQEERLDKTVFIQTTESIRNLQALDKNLLLLLYQSRYNSEFENSELTDTNYQISEEFDNLRFEALFEEIERSPSISDAISKFEQEFVSREETLDAYIESNTAIANSLAGISVVTHQLQDQINISEATSFQAQLGRVNSLIFDLVLGEDIDSEDSELIELASQIQSSAPQNTIELTSRLKTEIETIVDNFQSTQRYFTELDSLNTGKLLDSIENEYTEYHNDAISGSNQFRNALITYGLVLLGALLFFGYQIRKNYQSLEQQIADRTNEIKGAYDDLQESQEQLIQSEKMASLGQMVAGVAHEINTPLGYVTSNIDTLKLNLEDLETVLVDLKSVLHATKRSQQDNKEITEKIVTTLNTYQRVEAGELLDESTQLLSDGAYGLSEISKLVTSLKDFARLDRQNTEQVDIHGCVDSSVTIASNHIRENNVHVVKNFNNLPKIACFPSKLNQLFLNIITNACQAIGQKGGELVISTAHIGDNILISFKDDGIGMDHETQQKMFDPFFTSKEIGVGTGLGMSIAYKIVATHNGSIDVESTLGKGTTITVSLPNQ